MSQDNPLAALLRLSAQPRKPRVFVSYHHDIDQVSYNRFSTLFGGAYDVFTDTSLDRSVDSTNAEYLTRSIRENNINNSSTTLVLCGSATWKRRWIDWEIDMTLRKQHALLAIVLPSQPWNSQNSYFWPDRLFDNLQSGYAHWVYWTEDAAVVRLAISTARNRARFTAKIANSRARMERSRP